MRFDTLLKGGHLIAPKNGRDGLFDLAITDGVVAAVDTDIPSAQANQLLDVSGLYVTPGLVDIHAHMYFSTGSPGAWAGDCSIMPDGFSFRTGVTCMVDTGSAGWRNFADFRQRVLERFDTRSYAFVNICGLGMLTMDTEQNVDDLDVDRTAACMREHAEYVVGSKTAHFHAPEWISTDRALAAGQAAGMPAMIDFGNFRRERPYYELVTERMAPGDISTHMFLGRVPWIDSNGKVLDYLYRARDRGVIFDVGHGAGSFYFRNAVPAIAQGFYPDSISTDLHSMNMNGPMMDMATVMSKLLVLGMPLVEVIRTSTVNPAREIGHEELGHLSIGAVADVAALEVMTGDFTYRDVAGGSVKGDQRLFCHLTLKDGQVMWDWNSRSGTDYRELDPLGGVEEFGLVMPPDAP